MFKSVAGDSFDSIAKKFLGSEKYTPALIKANPELITTFIFDANVELNVPEFKTVKQTVLPWK